MKKYQIFGVVFIFVCTSMASENNSELLTIWNSDQVASIVGKVYVRANQFKAVYLSKSFSERGYEGPEWVAYQKSLSEIYENKSPYGDCALVMLINDFDDASIGEEIDHYITTRGKKMIPILELLEKNPLHHLEGKQEKERIENIDRLINAIKAGKIQGMN